jgi:two-component system, cell cycle response regulator DivK
MFDPATVTMLADILIADDYADTRELLRLILAGAGYHIREAQNGLECVSMARTERPHLVLLDLSMPILDGWGALRELRADERTRGIPCVALTAFADADREHALAAGFDAYLSKPYRSKDLLDTVGRLLSDPQGRQGD